MTTPLRLAGAAALCAALLLTACAKKTDQTTTSDTTTTQAAADAGATPAAGTDTSTAAPDAAATPAVEVMGSSAPAASSVPVAAGTMAASTNGAPSGGFISLPVYPGATELKDQDMSMSGNDSSVTMKVYSSKDDAKTVAEWYKAHLPASFKGGVLTAGDKSVGTFADEHTDGDQSVIVGADSAGATRIQLTTKHGK